MVWANDDGVHFSRKSGPNWSNAELVDSPYKPYDAKLSVDNQGKVHILYNAFDWRNIVYIREQ